MSDFYFSEVVKPEKCMSILQTFSTLRALSGAEATGRELPTIPFFQEPKKDMVFRKKKNRRNRHV